MNPDITTASFDRRSGDYPAYWGAPPNTKLSEERAAWVSMNVAQDTELRRRGLEPVEVRGGTRDLSSHRALQQVLAIQARDVD